METLETSIRAGDINDFHSCLPLIERNYGPSLIGSPLFQSHELFDLYSDNITSLIAEEGGQILGGLSIVRMQDLNGTVVSELCRTFSAELEDGRPVAQKLFESAAQTLNESSYWCIFDCFQPAAWQQAAEAAGFVPVGFGPGAFLLDERTNSIPYYWLHANTKSYRRSGPEIIPVFEPLARTVLTSFDIPFDASIREDALSYPVQAGLEWEELDYVQVAKYLQSVPAVPAEILVLLQDTVTPFKMHAERFRFFGARESGELVGIVGCNHDTYQQKVLITHLYGNTPGVKGWLCKRLLEEVEGWSTAIVETILSAYSSRIQKTFDNLGFIASAYLPAFFLDLEQRLDAVRLVKLMIPYPDETRDTTPAARNIRNLVDKSFRACELGQLVVRLMKDLHAFRGLGDGEIIRILQGSTQKLYRKGEPVFQEGEAQADMFVVIRGEIHITVSATKDRVLDRLQPGSVFGELAFLNGKPRNATATAAVDSLLLVINREAFDELVQQEQHLGFTVFRNIAIDLSEKLRASTAHLFNK